MHGGRRRAGAGPTRRLRPPDAPRRREPGCRANSTEARSLVGRAPPVLPWRSMPEFPEVQALAERLDAAVAGAPLESATAAAVLGAEDVRGGAGVAGRGPARPGRAAGQVRGVRVRRGRPAGAAPVPGGTGRPGGPAQDHPAQGGRGAAAVRRPAIGAGQGVRHRAQGGVVGAGPGRRRAPGRPGSGGDVGRVRRAVADGHRQPAGAHAVAAPTDGVGDRAGLRRRHPPPGPDLALRLAGHHAGRRTGSGW